MSKPKSKNKAASTGLRTAHRAWQKALDFAYHYDQPQEPKP